MVDWVGDGPPTRARMAGETVVVTAVEIKSNSKILYICCKISPVAVYISIYD